MQHGAVVVNPGFEFQAVISGQVENGWRSAYCVHSPGYPIEAESQAFGAGSTRDRRDKELAVIEGEIGPRISEEIIRISSPIGRRVGIKIVGKQNHAAG